MLKEAILATAREQKPETADQLVKETGCSEPVGANHGRYTEIHQIYRSLYPALKDSFKTLSQLDAAT